CSLTSPLERWTRTAATKAWLFLPSLTATGKRPCSSPMTPSSPRDRRGEWSAWWTARSSTMLDSRPWSEPPRTWFASAVRRHPDDRHPGQSHRRSQAETPPGRSHLRRDSSCCGDRNHGAYVAVADTRSLSNGIRGAAGSSPAGRVRQQVGPPDDSGPSYASGCDGIL